MAKVVK